MKKRIYQSVTANYGMANLGESSENVYSNDAALTLDSQYMSQIVALECENFGDFIALSDVLSRNCPNVSEINFVNTILTPSQEKELSKALYKFNNLKAVSGISRPFHNMASELIPNTLLSLESMPYAVGIKKFKRLLQSWHEGAFVRHSYQLSDAQYLCDASNYILQHPRQFLNCQIPFNELRAEVNIIGKYVDDLISRDSINNASCKMLTV